MEVTGQTQSYIVLNLWSGAPLTSHSVIIYIIVIALLVTELSPLDHTRFLELTLEIKLKGDTLCPYPELYIVISVYLILYY